MNFRPYHQIKNFKVLVGITIIILALYNFFKIDYENKFIYLIKFTEENKNPLILNNEINVDNPNVEFFKKISDKLYYYQNISSKSYNIEFENIIEFENNDTTVKDIQPKLEQKFYDPNEQRIVNIQKNDKRKLTDDLPTISKPIEGKIINLEKNYDRKLTDDLPTISKRIEGKIINLEKNYDRKLTKEEISKIIPDKIVSSIIQLKSKIKIDRAISNNPNIEFFIEIQDQYFLNNLILLILLIFISLVLIFIVLRKK